MWAPPLKASRAETAAGTDPAHGPRPAQPLPARRVDDWTRPVPPTPAADPPGWDLSRTPVFRSGPPDARAPLIQRKAASAEPAADPWEREAEGVAKAAASGLRFDAAQPWAGRLSGVGPNGPRPPAAEPLREVLRSPGKPLDGATRAAFGRGFGRDFSDVRIHTGPEAARAARSVAARAFTSGPHVVFGEDRYRPATPDGRELLAHELTHVVQQREAGRAVIQRKPEPRLEEAKPFRIVEIVAFPKSTTAAMAVVSNGAEERKEPVDLTANEYEEPNDYTLVHAGAGRYTRPDATKPQAFRWIRKSEYEWADTVKVTIVPQHIHDFLFTGEGQAAPKQDVLNTLEAARVLAQQKVTEDELLIIEGRRGDAEGIGAKQERSSDTLAWAQNYVAGRQERATTEGQKATSLYATARRLGAAPLEFYNLDKLLEIMEPESLLSGGMTRHHLQRGTYATPFQDERDVRDTLRAFEDALVFDLRRLANRALDETEAAALRMQRRFIGTLEGGREHAPAWVEREIAQIKAREDVATATREREENERALDEALPNTLSDPETTKRLMKQKKELDDRLAQTVGQQSNLKFSRGSEVEAVLSAKTGREAQVILRNILFDARTKIARARGSIGNRRTLYGADLVVAKEKELLAEVLGSGPGAVVGAIVDKLAQERREQTTIWEDIFNVLKILASFVPGPVGWGVRAAFAVVDFDKEMGDLATQEAFAAGHLATAPPPGSAATSLFKLVGTVGSDKLFTPFKTSSTPLTLNLGRSTAREMSELTAGLGGREVSRLGDDAVRLGEGGASRLRPPESLPKSLPEPLPGPQSVAPAHEPIELPALDPNESFIIERPESVGAVTLDVPPGLETGPHGSSAVGPVKTRKPAGFETGPTPSNKPVKAGTTPNLDNPTFSSGRSQGREVTAQEQQYGIPTPEEWERTRAATPPKNLQVTRTDYPVVVGQPDPALPGLIVTGTAQMDHVVSVDRIRRMDGFAYLDPEQQLEVLNLPENFVPLSPAANQSKGAKSFRDWLEHAESGTLVDPKFRADMIALEEQLEIAIQERINTLFREKMTRTQWLGPGPPSPF